VTLVAVRRELAAVRRAAVRDPLTGVLNRRGLADQWPGPGGWLALLDLDAFKPVNDMFGHAAGDRVLRVVAARLAGRAEVAARLGGDEFAVVVPGLDTVARLAADVGAPVVLAGGVPVAVGASIGVTPAEGSCPQALARADAAMYRAKACGGGVAVYDPCRDDRTSAAADPRPQARVRDLPHRDPAGLRAADGGLSVVDRAA
jgi:diguanylate cyclase (GGDEF)-like protein